jgi:phosphate transport system permease protein
MMGKLFYNNNASSTDITRKAWLLRVIPYVYNKENTVAAVKPKAKTANRSSKQIRMENFFRSLLVWIAVALVLIVLGILVTLVIESIPSIKALGIKYLWGKTWDPVNDVYGAWPFLIGTLLTSFTALIISIPFSFAVAIFLGEYYPNGWLSNFLKNAVELIAAVPSVIYGFWGFFVLVPMVRVLEAKIGAPTYGVGIFSASLVLAIMVIPYAASLSREIIRMVPSHLKEGAYALGATRYEVITQVILPYTKSGLLAGILLSLGRALGETMAVTMVIGNTSLLPRGLYFLFNPGNTMASVIANEFQEAASTTYLSALIELGLVLFLVTVVINMLGKRIISRFTNE